MLRVARAIWLASFVAGCTASPIPSASIEPAEILSVEPGESVQAAPPTEELKVAFSDAQLLAEANGNDLGYPWFDASTGELVLSAVTQRGRELIDRAGITAPHRIRSVTHGAGELRRIQDDATFLRSQGVPGAELIYETLPDHRDNRTLLVIRARSDPLLEALAARYPAETLAIEVNPAGT